MKPYYEDDSATVLHGDCLEVLPTREVVRPRTYGLANDGGYSGGLNTNKPRSESAEITSPATPDAQRWEGWGTALKPGHEPIVVARKPLAGTVAQNVLEYGTGALNVDGCRVKYATDDDYRQAVNGTRRMRDTLRDQKVGEGWDRPWQQEAPRSDVGASVSTAGRWPTNVVLDGDAADDLDRQGGTLTSGANPTRRSSDKFRDAYGEFKGQAECVPARGADSGGASRFFPVFRYEAKADSAERPDVGGVKHPTVKPLELMRWLVRLVTPPGGTVLDPFLGSGTTAEACLLEGFRCVGVERETDYLPLIKQRLNRRRDPQTYLADKGELGGTLFEIADDPGAGKTGDAA